MDPRLRGDDKVGRKEDDKVVGKHEGHEGYKENKERSRIGQGECRIRSAGEYGEVDRLNLKQGRRRL